MREAIRRRLAGRTPAGQAQALIDLVRTHVAATAPTSVDFDPVLPWRRLGIYREHATKLRHALSEALGVPIPPTALFDLPNPRALVEFLLSTTSAVETPAARHAAEPIAILGMACRYPGGVGSPEQLWDLVHDERCAISELPTDRGWDLHRLAMPDTRLAGTASTSRGGFINGGTEFDPEFFGISPREASAMHPEQRLLLETAWEAMERAGLVPSAMRGVGVFAGTMSPEYGPRMHEAPADIKGSVLTGITPSIASGRLSYTFGFDGPSITIDTACSASLVAIHLACQSLRLGESQLALAGGATFSSTPGMFTEFSRQGGLAPDGRCKSFAAAADGTSWSEGAGMLVLARLSDARRLGYPVLALIRGTSVNQDGASNGLSAPSGTAQRRLITQALANAGLSTEDIDAVEAHGTGTTLGDPIEAGAIIATYGQDRDRPLWLGSLKSNLGHAQAAAGVGGVIKMVMAMRHGILPRSLHIDEPSPHVDWSAGTVRLLTERTDWPEAGRPRRAGVSSFGISGTNAHAILEQAPDTSEPEGPATGEVPWVLSGHTEAALREQAQRLRDHVLEHPRQTVRDIGWSLATTRTRLAHRAVVVAKDRADFLAGLDDVDRAIRGVARPGGAVVFVFPGQGSQWPGMASELLASAPVFAVRFEECARALAPYCDLSLTGELDRVDVVQPALFAVMVSLAALWRSYGVEPSTVVGHSQGEIAAACVAGALSLEDAAKVVALRSRILATLAGQGGMASVQLSAAEARHRFGGLEVAAVNGPRAVVLSGADAAITEAVATLDAAGVWARRIPVDYASHSAQIDAVREEILASLGEITPRQGEIPFYSTVTGDWLAGTSLDAGYWYRNLRQPVRFADAISGIANAGDPVFIEVSPHPVLVSPVEQIADVPVLGTLRRDDGGLDRFTRSLAQAHASGVEPDWEAVLGRQRRVDLPTYSFQRRRFWTAAPVAAEESGHPWLNSVLDLPDSLVLSGRLAPAEHPWLAGHQVAGANVLPGSAFVELALFAAGQAGASEIVELAIEVPLPLGEIALRVIIGAPDEHGHRGFDIHARPEPGSPWTRHAGGVLGGSADVSLTPNQGDAEEVALSPELHREADRFGLHPLLLDALLQPHAAAGMPFIWTGIRLHAPAATVLRVWTTGTDKITIVAVDAAGSPVLTVDSLVLRPFTEAQNDQRPPSTGVVRRRAVPASHGELLDLVRSHTAEVLGHNDSAAIRDRATFKELGLSSLTALELRTRLGVAVGLRLAAAAVFDYPTPVRLAEHLRTRLAPEPAAPQAVQPAPSDIDAMDADALIELIMGNQ